MTFFKKIFGLNKLYGRKVGWAYFYELIYMGMAWLIMVLTIGAVESDGINNIGIIILCGIAFVGSLYLINELIKAIFVSFILKSRVYSLDITNAGTNVFGSATNDELNIVDKVQYIKTEPFYKIMDLRFDFYRKTKYGDYKAREVFYTVIEYKLARKLPHLVFDSRGAKGKQFKKVFVGSQQLNLEGNFNQYFDVYSPIDYHIDTLSFITPEVMQSMLELKDYDIEIKDDSLLCFSALLTNQELESFQKETENLYNHLNNNLDTYRDERLDFKSGKEKTTDFASSLLISPKKYIITSILSVLVISILVGIMLYSKTYEPFAQIVIYVTFILIYNIYRAWKLALKNRSLVARYKNNYN